MGFEWPWFLWLLLLAPVLAGLYQRRVPSGQAGAVRWTAATPDQCGSAGRVLQHLPATLQLLALCLLVIALSRPHGLVTLPALSRTVVMAVDVSGSMRATDLAPSRLAAAQKALGGFIVDPPRGTRFAVVSFAGTAALIQPPTDDLDRVREALSRLEPQRGTALGSAIVVGLAALFPGQGIELRKLDGSSKPAARQTPAPSTTEGAALRDSAAMVLLSDGQSTTGPDALAAARLAAEYGVRVYTVGIGSVRGEVLRSDGRAMRVSLDEPTLKSIAALTGAEYFQASDTAALQRVHQALRSRVAQERRYLEWSALFAGAAVLCALAGAALGLTRRGRMF